MTSLIIDASSDKIFLVLIVDKNIYTSSFENSKSNFEKLVLLIDQFLINNKKSINDIKQIYVNRGPGRFAGIRNSLSIVKGYHLSKKIDYFCFSFLDFDKKKYDVKNETLKKSSVKNDINYENIPKLCDKFKIKKNLINPLYLS
jgi:tRNA A37 threonylcarbamoyladenosine modification protein TsaB